MADETCTARLCKSVPKPVKNNTKVKKRSKIRKKKIHKPVTEVKTRKDRALITEIHALNKRVEAIKKNRKLSDNEKTLKISELEGKIDKLGGIDAYQAASKLGETRNGSFNSAKWVVKQLQAHGVQRTAEESGGAVRLLDVGALDHNYSKQKKWIECTAIDLNPQSRKVAKVDFLKMDTAQVDPDFDVVVLSLVINYEGDAKKRGEMLKKCAQLVKLDGYVCVVLPLPCLSNSRYFSKQLFVSMMTSLGFVLCVSHVSRRLSFAMFRNTGDAHPKPFLKQVLRQGRKHNNFCIVL